jgi:hypothetical protein
MVTKELLFLQKFRIWNISNQTDTFMWPVHEKLRKNATENYNRKSRCYTFKYSNIGEESIMIRKKYFLSIFSVSSGNRTMNIIQVFPEQNYARK